MKMNYVWKYHRNSDFGVEMQGRVGIVPMVDGKPDRSGVVILPPLDKPPFIDSTEAYQAVEQYRKQQGIKIENWRPL